MHLIQKNNMTNDNIKSTILYSFCNNIFQISIKFQKYYYDSWYSREDFFEPYIFISWVNGYLKWNIDKIEGICFFNNLLILIANNYNINNELDDFICVWLLEWFFLSNILSNKFSNKEQLNRYIYSVTCSKTLKNDIDKLYIKG